jgi:ERCC4-related helicase
LGKTHIAAVLIANFHVWFPEGLIFFLAPTKPLVDQQSMALAEFRHLVEPGCVFSLTGSVQVGKRVEVYRRRKVLFCTPQTLENDLREGRVDARQIVLIIFGTPYPLFSR